MKLIDDEITITLDVVVAIPGSTSEEASKLIDSMSKSEILSLALSYLDFIGEEKISPRKLN